MYYLLEMCSSISNISIAAWNISGLSNKINDDDFINNLVCHDIIVLSETFLDNDDIPPLPGYIFYSVYRKKNHKKAKHPYGGVIVFIKKNIQKYVTKVAVTKEHFIWIKISKCLTRFDKDLYCCCCYIPPEGSIVYKNNNNENFFPHLNSEILKYGRIGHILLTGDFNSRTSERNDVITSTNPSELSTMVNEIDTKPNTDIPCRSNKDKTVNKWGRDLLEICLSHELIILNGRTVGDFEGRYTYYHREGTSAIDLTLVSTDIQPEILGFKVHPPNEYSLHCKIETMLGCAPRNVSMDTDDCLLQCRITTYCWEGDYSRGKLSETLNNSKFLERKHAILNKCYDKSTWAVDAAVHDVEELLSLLHQETCKKKIKNLKRKQNKRLPQPWFTDRCQLLRNRVRMSGKLLSANPSSEAKKIEYFIAKREYNKLIKKSKREHKNKIIGELSKLNSEKAQEFWPLLKKLRQGNKPNFAIEINELVSHFRNLLDKGPIRSNCNHTPSKQTAAPTLSENHRLKVDEFIDEPKELIHDDLNYLYTTDDMKKILGSLKNGKSTHKDGILNEVLKYAKTELAEVLSKLFNLIEMTGYFPKSWRNNYLVPLHKKGAKSNPNNYRGLAVSSNLSKAYTKILNHKLTKYTETANILSPYQFGFRADYRTSDSIFTLKSILSKYKNSGNKPVYSCFIDLNKAFDTVPRIDLLYKLGLCGIKGNILGVLKSLYSDINYSVKANGQYSTSFKSTHGVKQGCNLSPLLFNLFINDIQDIFKNECNSVEINNWKFNHIAFADDLVLFSEKGEGLQNSILKLEEYCKKWGLSINTNKSKIVIFNRPFKKSNKKEFYIYNNPVEICKQFCYLGINITSTGSFHVASENLYRKALKALYSIYSSINLYTGDGTISLYLKLFNTLVKPIVTYASEVWGYDGIKPTSVISKFINKFYRNLLGLPKFSSTKATHLELGTIPIEINNKITMLKYWFRLIQLPQSRLIYHCYRTLLDSQTPDKWMSSVKKLLYESGKPYVWDQQLLLPHKDKAYMSALQKEIIQTIYDQHKQTVTEKISTESRLKYYRLFKNNSTISNYVTSVHQRSLYTILAKTRLGVLNLANEIGRRNHIPKEDRTCPICNCTDIEDEPHFILKCTAYTPQRDVFLKNCRLYIKHLDSMDLVSKYIAIMSSTNKDLILSLCKYTLNIYQLREEKLKQKIR